MKVSVMNQVIHGATTLYRRVAVFNYQDPLITIKVTQRAA